MLSEPRPRPIASIDADLHRCHAVRRDAVLELTEVRRRQAELAELEARLVITVEARLQQADRLLDERLRALAVAGPRQLARVD
ncbi:MULTISPECIES: hypothetical protein [unclassified Geodermatophilus]